MNKKPRKLCKRCNTEVKDRHSVFCCCKCSAKFRQELQWKDWDKNGISSKRTITIKEYVKSKKNNICELCKNTAIWNGKELVLILDHIDGNSENNQLSNLRLVCPNCDSQLPTFKGRNKGNGRHSRRQRYKEGKSY